MRALFRLTAWAHGSQVTDQAQGRPHQLWSFATSPEPSLQLSYRSVLGTRRESKKASVRSHDAVTGVLLLSGWWYLSVCPSHHVASRCRKVNKCYRGRSCPIIVHCRWVRARQRLRPGLGPPSSHPALWSFSLGTNRGHTACLPPDVGEQQIEAHSGTPCL